MSDMDREITVTVTGRPGVGKSAIAQQIADLCHAIDIPVTLEFINDEHPVRDKERQFSILRAIRRSGTTVKVIEGIKPRANSSQ